MGISVISSPTSSVNAATSGNSSSGAATAADGLPGDFAAKLFGEIQGLLASATEKSLSAENLDASAIMPQTDTQGAIDPAMIAALIGNAQLQQEMPNRNAGGALTTGNAMGQIPDAAQGIRDADLIAQDAAKTLPAGTFNLLEKAALAGRGPQHEAANIAVEANPLETGMAGTASAANSMASARPSIDAAASAHQSSIDAPLHERAWPQQFSEKIVWLAKSDQQSAQININPPQLGPVQITLNMSGDQATLAFASPHAEVRQAIESALPQLKEMLSSAGISLGQANVGANLAQQSPDNPCQTANGNRSANENAILPANDNAANTGSSPVLHRGRGLVDLFA